MVRKIIPGLGRLNPDAGWRQKEKCSDHSYIAGRNGVRAIYATGDGKVELIVFHDRTLAYVKSEMGYPAYYPVQPIQKKLPVKAVLMDLDGTTVRSEEFWIWIIEKTIKSLLNKNGFELEEQDLPYVSGHSVSEHLQYCIEKYCPGKTVEEGRRFYFQHTKMQMQAIMEGRGRKEAFVPNEGVKEFLIHLKEKKIKIGLVTSGLYEKAYPEILSAFESMGMGDPADFYDCIITAGYPLQKGTAGTLGEMEAKPHPWLYAEAYRVGLGIPFEDRASVLGIEDSGAGVCAVRLAGLYTIGLTGGNILSSGTAGMCSALCNNFDEISQLLKIQQKGY